MGKKSTISYEKKEIIIRMLNESALEQKEIAKIMDVSATSVARIKKMYKNGENLQAKFKGRSGSKRITSERNDRMILKHILNNRKKSTHHINNIIRESNINISNRTLRRRIKEFGLANRRPTIKQKLTKTMMKKRRAWGNKYKCFSVSDWQNVINSSLFS